MAEFAADWLNEAGGSGSPTSLSAIFNGLQNTNLSPYVGALGSVATFVAQLKQASEQREILRYNAKVAEANAERAANALQIEAQQHRRAGEIAKQEVDVVRAAQAYQEERQRERDAQANALSEAAVAASGLELSGSPLAVIEGNIRRQQYDILAGRYNTELRVRALGEEVTQREYAATLAEYGARERITVGGSQGALLRREGDQAYERGIYKGLSTLNTATQEFSYRSTRPKAGLLTGTEGTEGTKGP